MSFVECRICLVPTGGSNMISVEAKVMNKKNVLQVIEEVVSLQSSENDCLPKYICKKCFKLLKSMVVFRRLIVSSYEIFQKRLNQTNLEMKMEAYPESSLILGFDEKNVVEDNSSPLHSNNLQEDVQNNKPEFKLENNFIKNVCPRYKRIAQRKISSSAICKTKTRKIFKIKRKDDIVVEITKTDQTSSASRNTSQMCNVCEKMITGRQKYKAHMKTHNKQVPPLVYFCSVCPKKFSEKRYLVIHRRVHTGEKPFHCDICNKNFSQFSSFSLHKRRMHDKVIQGTCSYCGKKFVDKPELDVHIRMWHTGERPYLCEFCSATFVCNRTLQRHRKELHSEKKPCQKCGKMFGDYAMKKHLVRHQVLEEGLKIFKKKYTCEYCKAVMNFTSRRRHLEKQHGIKLFEKKVKIYKLIWERVPNMDQKCRTCLETCNKGYITISSQLNEAKTIIQCIIEFSAIKVIDGDPLPQSICHRCYEQINEFYKFRDIIIASDDSLKSKLNNLNTSSLVEKQEYLDNLYYEESTEVGNFLDIDTHSLKSEENVETDLKISDEVNGTSENTSPLINNNSPEYIDYSKTLTSNQKNKSTSKIKLKISAKKTKKIFECQECHKIFKKADHLNVHIIYKHTERQFSCEICHKKFARKYDLAYHSRVHTGERPFTCEMCGKSFASSSYFYIHKRIHTGAKKMKCEYCQSTFNNTEQLQIHIRQKHTGERPFLCEMCSHAFTSSSALFRHKRDVHDEKVECPICSGLYSSRVLKDHIKRHKEREEGIKRFSCDLCNKRFTCATSRKRHLVVHSGEKAFKCEVCEKSFNQRSTLQTHKRIHSQIMPFHCEICSKCFRYKHHLKIHCQKHHKNEHSTANVSEKNETSDIKTE